MRHSVGGALVVASAALAAAPGQARASGFHIDEQDARATGRGGAVTASARNASAISYNPAGIAELEGINIDIGGSWVAPSAEFTSAVDGQTTQAKAQSFVLPQAYVAWRASELVALGIGFNAPFGLALSWPASSPGRTQVRESELRTFFFSPVFAVNLSRWAPGLSLAAGADLVPASVQLSRDIPFGADLASVKLGGDAFGVGARAGISYRPPALRGWSFGLSYRSPVELDFSGDADFDAPPAYRASLPPDGGVKTELTLPHTLRLGIAYSPVPELELEIDGAWHGWSSYDRLDIELPDGSVQSAAKDWHDTVALRLGGEYTFRERWSVRLGAIWDQAPMRADRLEFQLPDANRIDLSAGFGGRFAERFRADLGVLYVLPQKRSTSFDDPLEPPVKGRFGVDAWVVGVSLGVQLDTALARSDGPEPADLGQCRPGPEVRATAHLPGCRP